MELLLRKQNLWKKVIMEGRSDPESDSEDRASNQAAIDKWDELDDVARGTIGLAIDDDQLIHIRSATTAKESWTALKQYHEKSTLANKVFLVRSICALKLEEGGDAKAHINQMQELFTKLNDLGESQLSTVWNKIFLLSSLPKSYDTLVSALGARDESEVTFDVAKQHVISEYERHANVVDGTGDSVLKTIEKVSVCFFCKKPNHQKKNCPKYKNWLAKRNIKVDNSGASGGKTADKINSMADGNFLFKVGKTHKDGYTMDSGATKHAVRDKSFFTEIDESYRSTVELANGELAKVNGIGKGYLKLLNEKGNICKAIATNVLYAPKLVGNVLSVRQLAKNGFKVEFDERICEIKHKGQQVGVADIVNDLYVLRQPDTVCAVLAHNDKCIHTLHRKMGHRNPAAIRKMVLDDSIKGLQIIECGIKEVCEVCMKGKMTRLPFPKKSKTESTAILDLIHSDVCGPMRTVTPSGKRYLVTFIDDYSNFSFVTLLAHKSEVEGTMKQFVAFCENKFGRTPKIMRSDRGGEYTSAEYTKFLKEKGIQIQLTAADCPQQNGKAERKNRTLIEMARCMLIDAELSYKFWGEAVATANFIQNRVITRTTNMTPYERWNGDKPGIDIFHIFGSKCFVHISAAKRGKLDNVANEMIFLGYDENSKAYRCYNAATNKVVISRDVRFSTPSYNDNEIYIKLDETLKTNQVKDSLVQEENDDHGSTIDHYDSSRKEVMSEASVDEQVEFPQPEQRISQRQNKGIPAKRLIEEINMINAINEPKNYKEAIQGSEKVQWLTAMQEEIADKHTSTMVHGSL